MRTVRPGLARNTEFGDRSVDGSGQAGQQRSSVYSDPEYARSLCGRKESVSGKANVERARIDLPQLFGDALNPLGRLFAYKLQGNVQRLGTHPAGRGRQVPDGFEKKGNAPADFTVEIDADKDSHDLQQRPADHLKRLFG